MVSPCESVAGNDEDLSSNVSTVFNHEYSGSEAATSTDQIQVAVNTALATQLEAVSSEKSSLQVELSNAKTTLFRIKNVAHNDSLINLYTGFASYEVFMAFYAFLGPSVQRLKYWGSSSKGERRRKTKLDHLNQLFMTLVKLKLQSSLARSGSPFSDIHYNNFSVLYHMDMLLVLSTNRDQLVSLEGADFGDTSQCFQGEIPYHCRNY